MKRLLKYSLHRFFVVILVVLVLFLPVSCGGSDKGNGRHGISGDAKNSEGHEKQAGESKHRKNAKYSSVTSATPYGGYEYKEVEQELHTLNLVNSLYLSRDQMRAILPLVKEMNKINGEIRELMAKNYVHIISVMKDMRNRLMTEVSVEDEQQKKLDKYAFPIYEKMAYRRDRVKVLTGKIKLILNPNQIKIIESYEPCIVPDGKVTDPQRIGGVGGDETFGELLEDIREMNDEEYKKYKKEYLDKKEMMMKVYNTPRQIRTVITQLENSMDKARKMDDMDFELKKGELMNISMPRPIKPGNVNLVDEAISKFLLNPVMIKYIEMRLDK